MKLWNATGGMTSSEKCPECDGEPSLSCAAAMAYGISCPNYGGPTAVSPELREAAARVVRRKPPTEEEIIRGGVAFVMGDHGVDTRGDDVGARLKRQIILHSKLFVASPDAPAMYTRDDIFAAIDRVLPRETSKGETHV